MERFQVIARTPVVDPKTGCWTAHGLKTMIALIQATGGGANGVIPLPSDSDLIDVLIEIQQLYAISSEIGGLASQGAQAKRQIDAMLDPSAVISMVGGIKAEISAIKSELNSIANSGTQLGGLIAEIKSLKARIEEVEALCLSHQGA